MAKNRDNGKIKLSKHVGAIKEPAVHRLEQKIRFSLKYCEHGNEFCIHNADKSLLSKIYKKLGYFEDLQWKQVNVMPREVGISIEKKDQNNHKIFCSLYRQFNTFGHIRIEKSGVSRIFGAITDDFFYILRFDSKGLINH